MGSRSRSNILQPRTDAAAAREARSATAPRGRSGKAPWLLLVLDSSDVDIARGCRNPSASSTRAAGSSDRLVCRVLAVEYQRAVRAPTDTTLGKFRRDCRGSATRPSLQDFAGSPPASRDRARSVRKTRSSERGGESEVYLAAAPASTLSWVPVTYRPLWDTRKITASLMSSGSAQTIGMALIPLNASATSAGTFSAP
jgi:hypothetical protein